MSWVVKLQDELGEETENSQWVMLHGVVPLYEESNFPLLRCIDPYGQTIFNHLQMEPFLAEWEQVRDFIVFHYCITRRNDSELWRYVGNMGLPDSLSRKMAAWTPSPSPIAPSPESLRCHGNRRCAWLVGRRRYVVPSVAPTAQNDQITREFGPEPLIRVVMDVESILMGAVQRAAMAGPHQSRGPCPLPFRRPQVLDERHRT